MFIFKRYRGGSVESLKMQMAVAALADAISFNRDDFSIEDYSSSIGSDLVFEVTYKGEEDRVFLMDIETMSSHVFHFGEVDVEIYRRKDLGLSDDLNKIWIEAESRMKRHDLAPVMTDIAADSRDMLSWALDLRDAVANLRSRPSHDERLDPSFGA